MRSGTAARRDREQISRLRPRLLSKKITVRQRLYNLRIVARQAQPEDANGPPKNEGEDLPRRGRRGRQDLPHPTIHPRPVRRPVHLDARREGLEERDQIGRAERGIRHRHDDLGHHGREGIPRTVEGSVLPWSSGRPRGLDRKSTRLNSSHTVISYAVFCLKKKNTKSMTSQVE